MISPTKLFGIGIVVMVLLIGTTTWLVSTAVEDAGGVKQILIDVGRDAKDIVNKVQEP